MSDTLREALIEACDLLAERKYGNPARSPGHNARLCLEAALSAPDGTKDRFDGATPRPWLTVNIEGQGPKIYQHCNEGDAVCQLFDKYGNSFLGAEANARLIVAAVNAYLPAPPKQG